MLPNGSVLVREPKSMIYPDLAFYFQKKESFTLFFGRNWSEMIRVGPVGNHNCHSSHQWDYKGYTRVSHIFLSCSASEITSIQFGFIEKGDIVLSKLHGSTANNIFRVISLKHDGSEYLTGLTGNYDSLNGITLLTFHTNKRSYEPFGPNSEPTSGVKKAFDLRIDDSCEFGGFFGSTSQCLYSIGFYITPKLIAEPAEMKDKNDLAIEKLF